MEATTRTTVPARTGRAVVVAPGDTVRVVDLAGAQVGDLFAFVLDEGRLTSEYLSASHTRVATSRLFPDIGEPFVTDRRRPVLTLVADDSPGHHDLLAAACDEQRYELLGSPGHASCTDNLHTALDALGFATAIVPQPVNVFMHVPVLPDGQLEWRPATTAPGDSITLRAELPCVLVLSACPQDLNPINGYEPTDLALDLTKENLR